MRIDRVSLAWPLALALSLPAGAGCGPKLEETPVADLCLKPSVIRLFVVEHVTASEVRKLLADFVDLEATAVYEESGLVLVRGTAAQAEKAAAVVRTLDRPWGEIDLDVDVLQFEGRGLRTLAKLSRRAKDSDHPARYLDADAVERLRRAGRSLAGPRLASLDGEAAAWQWRQDVSVSTGDDRFRIEVGFALTVVPRMHSDGDVTLEVSTAWTDLDPPPALEAPRAPEGEKSDHYETVDPEAADWTGQWSARLRPGETLLVEGILPRVEHRGMLAAALGLDRAGREIALALTPRVTRRRELRDAQLEILCTAAGGGPRRLCGGTGDENPQGGGN